MSNVVHSQHDERSRSDALLVLRVAEGDAAAYRELVQRYAGPLHHFALRLTRSQAEAEDVVQETFMRLWLRAAEYRPESRVTTWLHRIAHNLAVDRLRARGRLAELEADAEPAPRSGSPVRLLDAKRRAEALQRALDTLPERQATAIVLVHWHGLSGNEAAEVLGVTPEALESLLARGRRALRARLAAEGATDGE